MVSFFRICTSDSSEFRKMLKQRKQYLLYIIGLVLHSQNSLKQLQKSRIICLSSSDSLRKLAVNQLGRSILIRFSF